MAADTALTLIASSLRLLGVLASGETPAASEANDGLSSLNDLIDSWSTQNGLIPNKVREVFPLVVNQQAYQMGPGAADFNTSRAIKIENGLVQLNTTSPVIELPMHNLTKDQFAGIILKGITSTFPLNFYAEGTFPNDTINVWPIPSAACSIVLYSWKPLAELAALTTALSLPPGYQRALRYALAIELAPEYGKQVPEAVLAIAEQALADVKRINFRASYLRVDDALTAKDSVWNWRTGEPT